MTDTIAAIATPRGTGALGIVRISGPLAHDILNRVVPDVAFRGVRDRQMMYGRARNAGDNSVIDEVMCVLMRGPATATGEDVAEIYGHGGVLVMNELLAQVLAAGARAAYPGEFTSRGYRNGKIDLTQAEAVMALIDAKSVTAARVAARHLGGEIGRRLADDYDRVVAVGAELEVGLDFPDEDLPVETAGKIGACLRAVGESLLALAQTYRTGSLLTRGASVVIAGPPNAGKSSLLNCLLREERALVDEMPGTTRDVVEAGFEIDGIPVTFQDTAGIRADAGRVEQMGIDKARAAIETGDLLLLVVDGTRPEEGARALECHAAFSDRVILVENKRDLRHFCSIASIPVSRVCSVSVSARTGDNMAALIAAMGRFLGGGKEESEVLLTTARQREAVLQSGKAVLQAAEVLETGGDPELAAADVLLARESLAALWGRSATDDMIERVFSEFCLGK